MNFFKKALKAVGGALKKVASSAVKVVGSAAKLAGRLGAAAVSKLADKLAPGSGALVQEAANGLVDAVDGAFAKTKPPGEAIPATTGTAGLAPALPAPNATNASLLEVQVGGSRQTSPSHLPYLLAAGAAALFLLLRR